LATLTAVSEASEILLHDLVAGLVDQDRFPAGGGGVQAAGKQLETGLPYAKAQLAQLLQHLVRRAADSRLQLDLFGEDLG
jgi:hypothetical protein